MLARIPDSFLESVFYLYPSPDEARAGVHFGGSGFLMGYPLPKLENKSIIYGVTNAHVIDDDCRTIRLNTVSGGTYVEELPANRWVKHPDGDDLAVCVVKIDSTHKYKSIGQDYLLTREKTEALNIGPGDAAFVIGRFINADGRQKNLPTARSGIIAQSPWEKVRQRRQTASGFFDQESFLVEAKSVGGFSGSPVFVHLDVNHGRVDRPGLRVGVEDSIWLLGVDWGHIVDWTPVCDAAGVANPYGQQVRTNTGMMGVVPSWKLKDIFDCDELRTHRELVEEAALKKESKTTAALDSASSKKPVHPTTEENPNHQADFNSLVAAAARKQKSDE